MIEQKQKPTEQRKHRRAGSAFDTLAHVLRDIREIIFKAGFVVRNRNGLGEVASGATGFVPVKNMIEMYYTENGGDKVNGVMIGRQGDGESRNTSLIELSANANPDLQNLELGYSNGMVKLRATRDGINPELDRTGVSVGDPIAFGTGDLPEGVTVHIVGNGEYGGVVISHTSNRGDSPTSEATGGRYILITDEGIHIRGLDDSNPGGSGRLWKDGTTLRIT
jgi:hypothetical protein